MENHLAWQGSTHMLGPGDVVDQLRMQGPGAQRAPQRGCKCLLRRRPDDKQVWYLPIEVPLSDLTDQASQFQDHLGTRRLCPVTKKALMKASSGRMDPATICSLMDLQQLRASPT